MRPSLPQHAGELAKARRERTLCAQREAFAWCHTPGQPPYTREVPASEVWSEQKRRLWNLDMDTTLANIALGLVKYRGKPHTTVDCFTRYFPLRKLPGVEARWFQDSEFARQRLDGINPFLIRRIQEIPGNFPVRNEDIHGLVPDSTSLDALLAEGRLYLVDYKDIHGIDLVYGRFQVAPIGLFWTDERRQLRPLAIQLGQDPGEAHGQIFTPKDPQWTWYLARAFFNCADATYHELAAHLLRTHLVMETFWTAANRALPAQHPVWVLLQPHFTGTVEINHMARTTLIAPGGPIDQSIAVGAEGGLDLLAREYKRYEFSACAPLKDFERRGVLDSEALPYYHYRDDALAYWGVIDQYVRELLRVFYPSDQEVAADTELQAWYAEITGPEAGQMRGLPEGGFQSFEDLAAVLTQVIYTTSVEHSAVNNGQYDQFGWIPNTPGAMWLPPPTDKSERSEANFVYALPPAIPAGEQITLVHLLSMKTNTPLGSFDEDFFWEVPEALKAVDRLRAGVHQVGQQIAQRNETLEVPYTYLLPCFVGRSIAV